jgi:Zn-dependent protease
VDFQPLHATNSESGVGPIKEQPSRAQSADTHDEPIFEAAIEGDRRYKRRIQRMWMISGTLWLLTIASTLFVSALAPFPDAIAYFIHPLGIAELRQNWFPRLLNGATYCLALMAILTAHEFGHWIQARRWDVHATPPFFIPFPLSPLGTMGAVIFQEPYIPNRKALFDIGASGPWAGLVIALPLLVVGLLTSQLEQVRNIGAGSNHLANPLLVQLLIPLLRPDVVPGTDLIATPTYYAAWVGLLITGLNLMPMGQLDGGHIMYCLLGRRANKVGWAVYIGCWVAMIGAGLFINSVYFAWALMLVLVGIMRPSHPPTMNDSTPLGWPRAVVGWLTMGVLVLTFIPLPPVPASWLDKDKRPPAVAPEHPQENELAPEQPDADKEAELFNV